MTELGVTRIVNSCTLLEFGDQRVLTDPWFTERWHLHRGEGLGCLAADVPPLRVILGSHFFVNHWDMRGMVEYAHRSSTTVITSNGRMTRDAHEVGFSDVREVVSGDVIDLDDGLRIEVVAGGAPFGRPNNCYVVSCGDLRVFFGGEARDLAPLRAYAAGHSPVDVALLPVNGLHIPFGPRLVMNAATAVDAALALGASTLIPIHDAHARDLPWAFIRRTSTGNDARLLAAALEPALDVVLLHTGVRWERQPSAAENCSGKGVLAGGADRDQRQAGERKRETDHLDM